MSTTTNYSASRLSTRPTQPKAKPTPIQQAKDFWKASSIAMRCGVFGCLLLIAVAAMGLRQHADATSPGKLFPYNLTENQVQEVSRALIGWNVDNAVNPEGNNVLVAPDKRAGLLMRLSIQGLPHLDASVKQGDKFTSSTEAEARREHELEYALVQSIRRIDGVDDATVNLAIVHDRMLEETPKSSASVFVTMRGEQHLSPEQANGVAHLVAAAVPGLEDEKVAITDNSGKTVQRKVVAAADSFQLELQKELDAYLVGKAQSLLDQTYGPNKATVTVNAQFDFSQVEIKRTNVGKPGDGETVVVEQKTSEKYDKSKPGDPEAMNESGEPKYQKICEAKRVKSDEAYTWTVNKVPRVSKLTCAVSLSTPHQEENAGKLVAAAIGIDESRGDIINVAFVHRPVSIVVPHADPAPAEAPATSSPIGWLFLLALPMAALVGLFALKRTAGLNVMETQMNGAQPLQNPCDLTLTPRGQSTRTDLTQTQVQSKLEDLVSSRPRDVVDHLRSMLQTRHDN